MRNKFNNWQEFEFEGKHYTYELDGYKPLGVECVETGEYIGGLNEEHDRIYEAAIEHAVSVRYGRN